VVTFSQKLQRHEMAAIQADPRAKERVLRSYEMMLDFYGMRLKNKNTGMAHTHHLRERERMTSWFIGVGELERSKNYKSRYRNLNTSSHNYLRITRILKVPHRNHKERKREQERHRCTVRMSTMRELNMSVCHWRQSLGELGYEHLKAPFCEFIIREVRRFAADIHRYLHPILHVHVRGAYGPVAVL
jgi:hypothetical protein